MRFSFDTPLHKSRPVDGVVPQLRPWRCTMMKRAESYARMPGCGGGTHQCYPAAEQSCTTSPDDAGIDCSGAHDSAMNGVDPHSACGTTAAFVGFSALPGKPGASTQRKISGCAPGEATTRVSHLTMTRLDERYLGSRFGCACGAATQTREGVRLVPPILTGLVWSEVGRTVELTDQLRVRRRKLRFRHLLQAAALRCTCALHRVADMPSCDCNPILFTICSAACSKTVLRRRPRPGCCSWRPRTAGPSQRRQAS